MSWDYNYRIDGTQLSTYAKVVRIMDTVAPLRARNPQVPWMPGNYSDPDKVPGPARVYLDTLVRWTNSAGAVTHGNGEAGHMAENLAAIAALLRKHTALPLLQRNDPDKGQVSREVELIGTPSRISERNYFRWPLVAYPYWLGAARTGLGTPSLSNLGDAVSYAAVITFTGGTNGKLTNSTDGSGISFSGTLATPVVVDCATGEVTQGGSPADALVEYDTGYPMRFVPGSNTLALTGGGTVSIDLQDAWHV